MMNRFEMGLLDGLSAFEVAERLRKAADQLGWNKRTLSHYLFDMSDRRLHMDSGHRSAHHFALTQLDMDQRRCNELIQAGCALNSLEVLDEAHCSGAVSWSKVVAVLPVIRIHTQGAWVDFASSSTYRVLRDTVRGCRPGDLPEDTDQYRRIKAPAKVQATLKDGIQSIFEDARDHIQTNPDLSPTDEDVITFLALTYRKFVKPAPPPTTSPLPAAERNTEEVPAETRDAVLQRDQHRCRCCHSRFSIEVHHIDHRAHGGSNERSNLATLCEACHTLVHRGLLFSAGSPDSRNFLFHSATGQPIERRAHATLARRPHPQTN